MVEVLTTEGFDRWLRKLKDRQGRLRIVERLDRLAHGNPGDVKPVGQGVFELRVPYGPGYRVYYAQQGDDWFSCCAAGTSPRSTQDIHTAHQLAADWRSKEDETDEED